MKKTRKTAKAKPRRHGWQVVAFVPWRDEPTNFDSEYAYPTIYLNEVLPSTTGASPSGTSCAT